MQEKIQEGILFFRLDKLKLEKEDFRAAEEPEVDAGIADTGGDYHLGAGNTVDKTSIVKLSPIDGRGDYRAEKGEANLSAMRMSAEDNIYIVSG